MTGLFCVLAMVEVGLGILVGESAFGCAGIALALIAIVVELRRMNERTGK